MKTTILATLLATAVSASFAAAPTTTNDPATYRNVTAKAAADYKAAAANCAGMTGSAKSICTEEAKVARARAEADAVAQYNNTAKGRTKARTVVADADYALAKAKCADMTGADKSACLSTAASAHTAALADAKADRAIAGVNPVTTTATRDANKVAAVDKCAQIAGGSKTGCLIDNKTGEVTTLGGAGTTAGVTAATTAPGTVANRTANAVDNAADNTRSAAAVAAEKTRNAAATAVEKTKEVAANVADKTRNAAATVANKTDRATDNVADSATARKTGAVVADSVITTKVKADIFKEPELKSMAIHVETEKGVVMLSGFVDSKADADKAVKLAKSVEGVSSVKSAIKVK